MRHTSEIRSVLGESPVVIRSEKTDQVLWIPNPRCQRAEPRDAMNEEC